MQSITSVEEAVTSGLFSRDAVERLNCARKRRLTTPHKARARAPMRNRQALTHTHAPQEQFVVNAAVAGTRTDAHFDVLPTGEFRFRGVEEMRGARSRTESRAVSAARAHTPPSTTLAQEKSLFT
jgi:hypothetical protein